MVELIVLLDKSFWKPHLVMMKNDNVFIMEVCDQSAQHGWQAMINKYATAEVDIAVGVLFGKPAASVSQILILVSNPGIMYAKSGSGQQSFGLGRYVLARASQYVICGSLRCCNIYMRAMVIGDCCMHYFWPSSPRTCVAATERGCRNGEWDSKDASSNQNMSALKKDIDCSPSIRSLSY